jgi:hypothetical protein
MEQQTTPAITLDETFDLERDDTREVAIPEPIDEEEESTQPYQRVERRPHDPILLLSC